MTPLEHGEKIKRLAESYGDAREWQHHNSADAIEDDLFVEIDSLVQRCAEAERRLREVEADAAKLRALLFSVRSDIVHRPTMAVYLIPAIDQAMEGGQQ